MVIIGLDCATEPQKTGLAVAEFADGHARVTQVLIGSPRKSVARTVAQYLPKQGPALIALDAPLGWPRPLAEQLHDHQAGQPLDGEPNTVFRRTTDIHVQQTIGKTPLDVGADRIARTAHSALGLLQELRERTRTSIPLLWTPKGLSHVGAIEVYPAATLIAHKLRAREYKKPAQSAQRGEIIAGLRGKLQLACDTSLLKSNADALDAVVCVLAAVDFLNDKAMLPAKVDVAFAEGWIWVRPAGDAVEAPRRNGPS
jgi:predicted RNase H-like nuclease